MKRRLILLAGAILALGCATAIAAPKAPDPVPNTKPALMTRPMPLSTTIEDGYQIEESFFNVSIGGTPFLLQGLIVRKADAVGRLPIMLYAHGVKWRIVLGRHL